MIQLSGNRIFGEELGLEVSERPGFDYELVKDLSLVVNLSI